MKIDKKYCYNCQHVRLCYIYRLFNDAIIRATGKLNDDKILEIKNAIAEACIYYREAEGE